MSIALLLHVGIENIITPREWIERLESGDLAPQHRCLTFDDALKSQFDVALPVLEKYNLKAFWFVYSAPFEQEFPRLDLFRRFRYHYFDSVNDYYREFFLRAGYQNIFSSQKFKNWQTVKALAFPCYSTNDLKYRYLRDVILIKGILNYCRVND